MFRTTTSRQTSSALLVLRLALGSIFIAHGGQKLFVYGFEGIAGGFAQMGIPAANVMGPFVGFVEFLGGVAIVLGLLTRLASLGLAITMLVAIFAVHLSAGFFAPDGFEFPLSLLAIALSLLITGAGAFSIDALLTRRKDGKLDAMERRPLRKAA